MFEAARKLGRYCITGLASQRETFSRGIPCIPCKWWLLLTMALAPRMPCERANGSTSRSQHQSVAGCVLAVLCFCKWAQLLAYLVKDMLKREYVVSCGPDIQTACRWWRSLRVCRWR